MVKSTCASKIKSYLLFKHQNNCGPMTKFDASETGITLAGEVKDFPYDKYFIKKDSKRYIGASSMAAWEFQQLQYIAEKHGWHKFISMQNYYNLLYREEEREMIPYCQATGVGLVPWSPIARGVLTRPWDDRSSKRQQNDAMLAYLIRSNETEVDKAIVDRVEELSKKKGVPMAQVAIAWCVSKKGVNPIVGLSKPERIEEAVGALKAQLSDEEVAYLEEPYRPKRVQGY